MNRLYRLVIYALAASFLPPGALHADENYEGPIIDMHMHAFGAPDSTAIKICAPVEHWPAWDLEKSPEENFRQQMSRACENPISSAANDDELLEQTLSAMREHNIYGMLGGRPEMLERWTNRDPGRFMPSLDLNLRTLMSTPQEIRELAKEGAITAIFEVMTQYHGIPANSAELDPYFALAQELDLPIGIHFSQGPPGNGYLSRGMRVSYSSPLLLEEVLLKYPRARVWVSHGAYPFIDDMKAMLLAHPRLYLDVGIYSFVMPEPEYHGWICSLVNAGFYDRIMFGSDSQFWPETISIAIDRTARAPCLNPQYRRAIFYDNAASFLGLSEEVRNLHRSGDK